MNSFALFLIFSLLTISQSLRLSFQQKQQQSFTIKSRHVKLNLFPNVDVSPIVNNFANIRGGSIVAALQSKLLPYMTKPVAAIATITAILLYILLPQIRKLLWTPSRTYDQKENTVGREYDAWTTEGILEYYWGEHIHLGYYNEEEMKNGYLRKNFIQAKYDFIDRMLEFGDININGFGKEKPIKVLDVGCGIGGTSRYIAKKLNSDSTVTGITLSSEQVRRGTELAKERGITNVNFEVMDALQMKFPDNSFDIVWACESGEHMPDKKKYIDEMVRVLKPGGRIVVATWCQRDDTNKPFDADDRKMLDFLYAEWTHPYFISIQKYAELMKDAKLTKVKTDDWMIQTIASWRHSIWVGVFDPWPVIIRPYLWYKCFRDGLTLERMHQAFASGLMEYGMMTGTKPVSTDI